MNYNYSQGPQGVGEGKTRLGRLLCCNKRLDLDPAGVGSPGSV